MTAQPLTGQSFDAAVSADGIVLVDFWAEWCGPCRQFAPIFEAASELHPDIMFGKVDTEAERDLAQLASISSIPTLMAFRDGILVFSQAGALPAASLEQVIAGVRGLDMDDVRRQIAAADQQSSVAEVGIAELAEAHALGATVLDVREPAEHATGYLQGSLLIPMGELKSRVMDIPGGERIYVICASGKRSALVTEFLAQQGFDAVNVAGGMNAWTDQGFAVTTAS